MSDEGPPPPPGSSVEVDPEYAAESNLGRILGVITVFHFFALLTVALRLHVRGRIVKSVGADDYTIAGAALCSLGGYIIYIYQSFNGLGRHAITLTPQQLSNFDQGTFWLSVISSSAGIALLKVSIALHLLRLSSSRWYRLSLWASIGFVCAYSFMGMMTFFLHCTPMKAHWDKSDPTGECYSVELFILFALLNSAFNIFTDVLFATFPIPIIWKLQMKQRTKIYLIGILSLGYSAAVFGVLKSEAQINYNPFADNTFETWITFWAGVQINVGIIAACAPSLKPLVSKALKLSTYGTGAYGSRSRNNQPSSRSRGSRHLRSFHRDAYHMEELSSQEDINSLEEQQKGHTSAVVSAYHADGGSKQAKRGSQDGILEPAEKGIVRTTTVTIE